MNDVAASQCTSDAVATEACTLLYDMEEKKFYQVNDLVTKKIHLFVVSIKQNASRD